MKTAVVFRKFPDNDLIALLPELVNSYKWQVLSYIKLNGHAMVDYQMIIRRTVPATIEESACLKKEMEALGYDLRVVQKFQVRFPRF